MLPDFSHPHVLEASLHDLHLLVPGSPLKSGVLDSHMAAGNNHSCTFTHLNHLWSPVQDAATCLVKGSGIKPISFLSLSSHDVEVFMTGNKATLRPSITALSPAPGRLPPLQMSAHFKRVQTQSPVGRDECKISSSIHAGLPSSHGRHCFINLNGSAPHAPTPPDTLWAGGRVLLVKTPKKLYHHALVT